MPSFPARRERLEHALAADGARRPPGHRPPAPGTPRWGTGARAGGSAGQTALDGLNQSRTQLTSADHGVDRAHLDRPLDAVDAVELHRDLAQLLGPHTCP